MKIVKKKHQRKKQQMILSDQNKNRFKISIQRSLVDLESKLSDLGENLVSRLGDLESWVEGKLEYTLI